MDVPEKFSFPWAVGPFQMASVQSMTNAINNFYRTFGRQYGNQLQKPSLPAEGDDGAANIYAGYYVSGDFNGFMQFSPLHVLTLSREMKRAASIPEEATSFAWAYPGIEDPEVRKPAGSEGFLQLGGFVYFSSNFDVVGSNALAPVRPGTPGLEFGRRHHAPKSFFAPLLNAGRFQEITLNVLAEHAKQFCWLHPGELGDRIYNPNGAFAYEMHDGRFTYFPVVGEPYFTPDRIQFEVLDPDDGGREENDVIVVVEDKNRNLIAGSTAFVLDKTKSIREQSESFGNVAVPEYYELRMEENFDHEVAPVIRSGMTSDVGWTQDLDLDENDVYYPIILTLSSEASTAPSAAGMQELNEM